MRCTEAVLYEDFTRFHPCCEVLSSLCHLCEEITAKKMAPGLLGLTGLTVEADLIPNLHPFVFGPLPLFGTHIVRWIGNLVVEAVVLLLLSLSLSECEGTN